MVWITGARISHDSLPFNAPQGWVPLTHRESNCLRGAGVVVYPSALSSAAARATPCECGYVNHWATTSQRYNSLSPVRVGIRVDSDRAGSHSSHERQNVAPHQSPGSSRGCGRGFGGVPEPTPGRAGKARRLTV